MSTVGITVCIATIPPRKKMLRSALWSVLNQNLQPDAIIVEYDHNKEGAAVVKSRALAGVRTPLVAWLDDDDTFLPNHLNVLYNAWLSNNMPDVVYPWPVMNGSGDPRPDRFGVPFDADELRRGPYVPTTALFNPRLAKEVGGFQMPPAWEAIRMPYDDWGLWLAMLDKGATFLHVPERTWVWNVLGQNTSGDPSRW